MRHSVQLCRLRLLYGTGTGAGFSASRHVAPLSTSQKSPTLQQKALRQNSGYIFARLRYLAYRRAISACVSSRRVLTNRTHSGGQTGVVTVRHALKAATASSRRAVPLSRSPSRASAPPRFFCVIAQSSGTRSRVLSSSAARGSREGRG